MDANTEILGINPDAITFLRGFLDGVSLLQGDFKEYGFYVDYTSQLPEDGILDGVKNEYDQVASIKHSLIRKISFEEFDQMVEGLLFPDSVKKNILGEDRVKYLCFRFIDYILDIFGFLMPKGCRIYYMEIFFDGYEKRLLVFNGVYEHMVYLVFTKEL